jgi:two-component system CheB/CheR fusion protein
MPVTESTREFESLLDFLKRNRGFDFTGYKRATLLRRVQKRMEAVGAESYDVYHALLEAEPGEFTELFNTLLINVTRFFRDETPWEFLATDVIPGLLARNDNGSAIRVWSAGCASGEEAYTLAMVLSEAMGVERFRERVKIYATDVDEDALATARAATYTERQVADVPEALRERYFENTDGRYVFRKDLRRSMIFGRNDLVQDAPISRIDLLVCRNTLMYFNAATQAAVLDRFHFALADDGILVLGRAETLLTHSVAFTPLDLKRRIFAKIPRVALRERLLLAAQAVERERDPSSPEGRLRDAAFEAGGAAQIVVDRGGTLVLANERARAIFALQGSDIGRPLQDLELSYRPVELRSLIEQSYAERRVIPATGVSWRPRNAIDDRLLVLEVVPLADADGSILGASVAFGDVTEQRRLQLELEESKQNLETAYEELQSTNEELETTNEELQSTVEELETTNEELQSTNEELETMNEELRSTNEELETMNDELRHRGEELHELNAFLESIFGSMRGGVVVIDRDMRVMVWSAESEEFWGVRASEVIDTNFLTLDIGLPVEQLAAPIRAVLTGHQTVERARLSAVNRRGRPVSIEVTCAPLRSRQQTLRGVILTMEDLGKNP